MATSGRDDDTGLMSSAGLVRYFDAEDESFSLNPLTILLAGLLFSLMAAVPGLLF